MATAPATAPSGTVIEIRELEVGDYNKGYYKLLGQLTTAGDVSEEDFRKRFDELKASGDYRVVVAEDISTNTIVGTATVFAERKFIRSCGKAGHVEDVVVDSNCRGQRLGQRLIEALMDKAKDMGCYKIILDCAEHNVVFYEKCGLTKKEVQMVKYFDR